MTNRLEGLDVHISQTLELALTATLLGGLGIVGQTGTGVVKRVHEDQRRGTGQTTRGHVAHDPLQVALALQPLGD